MARKRESLEILDEIDEAANRPEVDTAQGVDWWVFGIAAALVAAFVGWGAFDPAGVGKAGGNALTWTMDTFGWLFVLAGSLFVIYIIWLAASKFGMIPLGKDDEKPQYSTWSWIAMMFATGMGIGLMFYGVGEPLFFFLAPPPDTADPATAQALEAAMATTMFHWTIYPWAMYALVGAAMGYSVYRLGRTQLFSSMYTALFGEKVVGGWVGRIINIFAIFATLFGSACSLGLGALQIGGGLESAGVVATATTGLLILVIAILTAAFCASALLGIERGIARLADANAVLAVLLALLVFIVGPTLFILNVVPNAMASFIGELPQLAGRTPALGDEVSTWLSSWTVFYWAWWVSWSPFVGMFIARISRGRTLRQFVAGVLIVPSLISVIWFSIFGGTGIKYQWDAELAGATDKMIVPDVANMDFDLVLFDTLEALPVPAAMTTILVVIAVILIAIFFVTGADSASIVMAGLSQRGAEEPARPLIAFWGVATGAAAALMLVTGGSDALNGIKNITIVTALPFVMIMLVLMVSFTMDLQRDPMVLRNKLAMTVLEESIVEGVDQYDGAFKLETAAADDTAPNTEAFAVPGSWAEAHAQAEGGATVAPSDEPDEHAPGQV